MRPEQTLDLLRKKGRKGVSSTELAKKFKFKLEGSSCKIIKQLREEGHDIHRDKVRGVYILIQEKVSEETGNSKKVVDVPHLKTYGKKDKVLECLLKAGTGGTSTEEIAEYAGIDYKNVCSHIHSLRHTNFQKIENKGGLYFLTVPQKSLTPNKGINLTPVNQDNNPIDLDKAIGIKTLLKGADNISLEDLPGYMSLVKKVIYYGKCAAAMLETNNVLESLTIGDDK
jgi:biotin operon repressor